MSTIPRLHVALLGGFSLTVNEQPLTTINQPQQQSLLAYLMLQTRTPQLRRQIAFLFWPDSNEARAYANLRRALHKLRHDCPVVNHFLVSTATTLAWQRTAEFAVDVATYEALLQQAATTPERAHRWRLLRQAAAIYRGELLPSCYDEWLLAERERLHQQQLQLLHQLTDALTAEGDFAAAIHYATELRSSDPLREQSYRLLMTLHEQWGDRAAALHIYHECEAMLARELGVEPGPELQTIYRRLLDRRTPAHRVEALPTLSHTPSSPTLVGRAGELQQLLAAWQRASAGQPHLILIQGEAGIGKTHLAEALLTWASQRNQLTVQTRAYAAEGQLSYSPVVEWLNATPYADLARVLADVWLVECSRLLPELLSARPDLVAPPPLTDSAQRRLLFEALARAVLIPGQPLLVLFDDLQWADQETVEWLHFLLRFDSTAPLLLVGTVRMSEVPAAHPLTDLQQELHRTGRIQEIALAPLSAEASAELAQQTAGTQLQAEILTNLQRYAEGVPLFLVEAVRAEIDKTETERWRWSTKRPIAASDIAAPDIAALDITAPNPLPLPPKVYAVIHSRLNQLSPGARQVANMAAVIGRAFSLELLGLATQSDEPDLIQRLDELWQRRIVREQGTNYDLGHDRIRDVTYAELSPIQRKVLHRRVAEALLQRHDANLDAVSAQLAYHYEAAGLVEQAVSCYLQAGTMAQQIYANHRAHALASRGLALAEQLPASAARDRQELDLRLVSISAVRVLQGWASTELYELINQTVELSNRVTDPTIHFRLKKGLFGYHVVRGDLNQAAGLAEELLHLAKREQVPLFLVVGYNNLGGVALHRGRFQTAKEQFSQSLAYYAPGQHKEHVAFDGSDYGILSSVWLAQGLWCLGYPEQALDQCQSGVDLANGYGHPASQVMALAYQCLLYQLCQEPDAVQRCADRCLSLAKQHTIGYYQEWAAIFYTWSLAHLDPTAEKIAALRAALDDFRATGGGLRWSHYLALLAGLYGRAGEIERGLDTISHAFTAVARTGEEWWNAELYRLRGELLSRQSADSDQIVAVYQQAIDLARAQGALSLELRATTSLARLWQTQGETAQAHTLLASVYAQFTEGFETPDLLAAQTLLADLTT